MAVERTVTVGSKVGLHARPAALFANAVAECGFDVRIEAAGGSADAASLIEVMTLGVGHGDEVTLLCEDEASASALDSLVDMLASDLDA